MGAAPRGPSARAVKSAQRKELTVSACTHTCVWIYKNLTLQWALEIYTFLACPHTRHIIWFYFPLSMANEEKSFSRNQVRINRDATIGWEPLEYLCRNFKRSICFMYCDRVTTQRAGLDFKLCHVQSKRGGGGQFSFFHRSVSFQKTVLIP